MRLTVGRTWRVTRDGRPGLACDLTGYRDRVDTLKSGLPGTTLRLPWPPYVSRLWTHMYNGTYQNADTFTLVATLLPLRCWGGHPPVESARGAVIAETEFIWHPFAVTSLLHLSLPGELQWPATADDAAFLNDVLRAPLTRQAQVRDGLELPASIVGTADPGGVVDFVDRGSFVFTSALHTVPGDQIAAAASGLALMLADDPDPDRAGRLKSLRGAICVEGTGVGMVLPADVYRAGNVARCLHTNFATLLAYLENLRSVATDADPTEAVRWFRSTAQQTLDHLYRRAPLPKTGSIYRSRLPELWLDKRGLPPAVIDQLR
ncbi:MAG: hypothetical protein L0H96_11120 [Humibacillus sp.]|nr:hypothetical protein [Humibacillus sp.]MDN5777453.1 hypothetical protein [Humibacillus sp.]